MTLTRAYVNHGRWVADCPRDDCANAVALTPRQSQYHCGGLDGCLMVAEVRWPANADAIWETLAMRPVPATRNWAPAGHRQAIVCGVPDGQTVEQLRAEQAEHGVT